MINVYNNKGYGYTNTNDSDLPHGVAGFKGFRLTAGHFGAVVLKHVAPVPLHFKRGFENTKHTIKKPYMSVKQISSHEKNI